MNPGSVTDSGEERFNDERAPEQFLGVRAVDDIDRTFRYEGEGFNKIMRVLYAEHVRVSEAG